MESPADDVALNSVSRKRQCAFSDGATNNNSSLNSSKKRSSSVIVKSFDMELLDCPICFKPFDIPIFQCENGHTACSSCCQNIAKKCPSCAMPIGSIRCRAIEMVLESVQVRCRNVKYRCFRTFSYGKSFFEHEKICAQFPCSCPIQGCKSKDNASDLYEHCTKDHLDCVSNFIFDYAFTISFSIDDKFVFLRERGGVLFILSNRSEKIGNFISVSRIGAPSAKEVHSAHIRGLRRGHVIWGIAEAEEISGMDFPGVVEEQFTAVVNENLLDILEPATSNNIWLYGIELLDSCEYYNITIMKEIALQAVVRMWLYPVGHTSCASGQSTCKS
ncbi:hypothetical protein JCGZ_02505 [Jatropha curcas]|uniref:RING-type E3 ubiquitin transferase n=1 Tax=Jatropha curcas TaxID=180498 RepID=A0A067JIL7_JATCU|nr:hypothetical protein JCGZ_02505 [Jatropha curcas]